MADYRDPKVTTTGKTDSGMSKWIGIAIAALVVIGLIWWWMSADDDTAIVAPTTEGTVTEQPATIEEPATAPVQQ